MNVAAADPVVMYCWYINGYFSALHLCSPWYTSGLVHFVAGALLRGDHRQRLSTDSQPQEVLANCCRVVGLQRGLPEGDARWLFQQIALAVDFCHRLGIALRDIKVSGALTLYIHVRWDCLCFGFNARPLS